MSWQRRRPTVSLLAEMALRQERVVEQLVALRERHALGQEDAARKIGIGLRQYQRWEAGTSMPRAANLARAAEAYGVSPSVFYDDEPDRPPANDTPDVLATLKLLVDRQESLAEAVAALTRQIDADRKQAPSRRRRAS